MAEENLKTPKPQSAKEMEPDADHQSIDKAVAMARARLGDILSTTPDYLTHTEMKHIIEQQKYAFAIVKAAENKKIPKELIDHFLDDFIVQQIALGSFKVVADLLRNLKRATPEEQEFFDRLTAAQAIRTKVQQQRDALAEQQEVRRKRIRLPRGATLADLNRALSAKDVVSDMYELFIKALYESPQKERGEALLDVWDTPQAATITIVDFFDCDPEDVQEELPIDWIDGNA